MFSLKMASKSRNMSLQTHEKEVNEVVLGYVFYHFIQLLEQNTTGDYLPNNNY